MKKFAILILTILFAQLSFAQTMVVHKKDATTTNFELSQIDSITFSVQQPIPTDSLVAYYPFNGNANDESGGGYDGTIYGASLTADRFGKSNSAYNFNGTSDYIDLTNTNSLNFETGGFTLTAWVKFTANNFDEGIVGKHVCGVEAGYFLGVGSFSGADTNSFQFYLNNSRIVTPEKYNDGNWHLVVGVYDGTNYTVYVDGVNKISQAIVYNSFTAINISIGRAGTNCVYTYDTLFQGVIDDVRIYSRPLSDSEIQQLYHEGGW